MRCYIWGTNNLEDRREPGRGVIAFVLPDWGIQYRAASVGSALGCEYGALLAFLQFARDNPKVFEGQRVEICSDSVAMVEQVSRRIPVGPAELKDWTLVRTLRTHVPFDLVWIPPDQNRAIEGVLDLAPRRDRIELRQTPLEPRPRSKKQSPPDVAL